MESEDPPLLDLKYFAIYDTDFGFKVAVDGIHNLPRKNNTSFYVVLISLNPPSSMYTEARIPSSDVSYHVLISIGKLSVYLRLGIFYHVYEIPGQLLLLPKCTS